MALEPRVFYIPTGYGVSYHNFHVYNNTIQLMEEFSIEVNQQAMAGKPEGFTSQTQSVCMVTGIARVFGDEQYYKTICPLGKVVKGREGIYLWSMWPKLTEVSTVNNHPDYICSGYTVGKKYNNIFTVTYECYNYESHFFFEVTNTAKWINDLGLYTPSEEAAWLQRKCEWL